MEPLVYHRPISNEKGFTLIEVMVVIVVIGIMAAIVAPKLLSQPDIARHNTATANVKIIGTALQLYQLQQSRFPTSDEGLQALVRPVDGSASFYPDGGYLDKDGLVDPWGNAYGYQSPGQYGPFDLICLGKDGVPGGDGVNADISNW